MMDKNDKPIVNFVALQSVEDYVEKSGKFRTECASFKIPGRDSGSASALYIPYCEKQRFDYGPALNDFRGHGVFTPPEVGKPLEMIDFAVFREHFHDIHCPQPCRGYLDKRVAAEKPAPRVSKKEAVSPTAVGKWTRKEIVAAVVVPVLVCLVGAILAWLTPEGRLLLHLDKPQPAQQISSPSASPTIQNPPESDPRAEGIQSAVKARDAARERLNRIRERQHEPPVTIDKQGNQAAKKELTITIYPRSASLKEESLFLSFYINSYVVERLENGPPYVNDAKDTSVVREYDAETLDKYKQSYGSQVMHVHDRLRQQGLQDPALDELYLNPATIHGIRVVADRLQELADRLPDKPAPGP